MSDEPRSAAPQAAGTALASRDNDGFPSEPFPCPKCGQMLGPRVRVCVACRQPVDPAQIRLEAPPAQPGFRPAASQAVDTRPRARFSWPMFAGVLLVVGVLVSAAADRFGATKALYFYWGIQLVTTIWMYLDARAKGIARPWRWAVAALLMWMPFFAWYLARRRQPQALCAPLEGDAASFLRVLLLVTAIALVAALVTGALANALHLPKPM